MPIRIKSINTNTPAERSPEFVEVPFENRETTVDGQTFHWAHNQKRSFADDGVGLSHSAFVSGPTVDNMPFDSRS